MKRFAFFTFFGLLFSMLPTNAATARKAEIYFVRHGAKSDAICALDISTQRARLLWQARKHIFGLAASADASQFTFSMDSNPEPSREQLAKKKLRGAWSKFDVYILTRRTNRLRNVTAGAKSLNCWQSDFVPGRNFLTFAGHTIKGKRKATAYAVDFNGGQLAPLFERGTQLGLTWSLDAQRLAWIAHSRSSEEVITMEASGQNFRRLTNDRFKDQSPNFSPDSKSIVFVSLRGGAHQVFVMDANGKNVRQLTRTQKGNFGPHFSPDGRHIVFTSNRAGTPFLYTMNSDGSAQKQLASTRDAAYPIWK